MSVTIGPVLCELNYKRVDIVKQNSDSNEKKVLAIKEAEYSSCSMCYKKMQKEIQKAKEESDRFIQETERTLEKVIKEINKLKLEMERILQNEKKGTPAFSAENKSQGKVMTAYQLYEKGQSYDLIGDYDNAFTYYKKAAEKGCIEAQYISALRYCSGKGITEKPREAFCWMNRAAENNYYDAMFELGTYYEKGYGTERDLKRAKRWYEKAAEHGQAKAKQALKSLAQNDTKNTMQTQANIDRSDNEKDMQMEAMTASQLYKQGEYYDKIKDFQNAFAKYKRAAEKGYVEAQYVSALRYGFGNGVEENPKEAFRWMNRAAENGYLNAMFKLGTYYEMGYGIEKNLKRARQWYELASAHGSHDARQALEHISENVAQKQNDGVLPLHQTNQRKSIISKRKKRKKWRS